MFDYQRVFMACGAMEYLVGYIGILNIGQMYEQIWTKCQSKGGLIPTAGLGYRYLKDPISTNGYPMFESNVVFFPFRSAVANISYMDMLWHAIINYMDI